MTTKTTGHEDLTAAQKRRDEAHEKLTRALRRAPQQLSQMHRMVVGARLSKVPPKPEDEAA